MLGRALFRAGGGSLMHLYLQNSAAITDAGIRQLVQGLTQLKVLQLTAFTAATTSPSEVTLQQASATENIFPP